VLRAPILEPGPAELDHRQQALPERSKATSAGTRVSFPRQGVDHSIERFEGHGRPVIDRQNHVVFTKCGLGFVGRATWSDTAHAHALTARPLEFPAAQPVRLEAVTPTSGSSRMRVDALPFGRGERRVFRRRHDRRLTGFPPAAA
jgi:hypothetical protein